MSTPRRDHLNNLNAVIEYVLTRPISTTDRIELHAIQDDLEQLHQRVAAVLGGYDRDILRQPVYTAMLQMLRDLRENLGPLKLARDEPDEAISRS